MIKLYCRVTKLAFWQFLFTGIVGLGVLLFIFYLLFLNQIMSANELIARFIWVMPFVLIITWVSTRIIGYSLCDEGVAAGRINSNGFFRQVFIRWEDAIRIKYKLAYIKVLGTSSIIVYSNAGTKVIIQDSQREFQEILDTIREKAKIHDIPFVTK